MKSLPPSRCSHPSRLISLSLFRLIIIAIPITISPCLAVLFPISPYVGIRVEVKKPNILNSTLYIHCSISQWVSPGTPVPVPGWAAPVPRRPGRRRATGDLLHSPLPLPLHPSRRRVLRRDVDGGPSPLLARPVGRNGGCSQRCVRLSAHGETPPPLVVPSPCSSR